MGDLLLRKVLRVNYERCSPAEIEAAAEAAALMQEQHARDVVSMAQTAGVRRSDVRVQRAQQVVARLR